VNSTVFGDDMGDVLVPRNFSKPKEKKRRKEKKKAENHGMKA